MGTLYLCILNTTKRNYAHDSLFNGLRHPKGANPVRHAAPRTITLWCCYRQPITNWHMTHFLPSGPDVRHALRGLHGATPRCSENYHELCCGVAQVAQVKVMCRCSTPNPTRHATHRTITNPFCYRQPITNYAVCTQVFASSGTEKLNQKKTPTSLSLSGFRKRERKKTP